MPRTVFHQKLEEQIRAIELVAKETQGVATAITAFQERPGLADLVIALATGVRDATEFGTINCGSITCDLLPVGPAQDACRQLGFTNEKLRALCLLIKPPPEPTRPPPISPPRGKGSAKKR